MDGHGCMGGRVVVKLGRGTSPIFTYSRHMSNFFAKVADTVEGGALLASAWMQILPTPDAHPAKLGGWTNGCRQLSNRLSRLPYGLRLATNGIDATGLCVISHFCPLLLCCLLSPTL